MRICLKVLGFSSLVLFYAQLSLASPDIVFIGAGPIGLYTAIQTVLHNPKVKIHFFERQEKYTRDNTVNIDPESFLNAHGDREFQEIVKSWGKRVALLKMEKQLAEKAKNLGIQIEIAKIEHPKEVTDRFPEVKVIVGSDGSHSLLRQAFMPESSLGSKDLQYIAQVKYKVQGQARRLNRWTEALPLLARVKHLVLESIGPKDEEQQSSVTLNIVLPESEYKQMKDKVTFKTPVHWPEEQDRLSKNLQKTVGRWTEGRGEKIVPGSIQVTTTKLLMYFAPKVAFVDEQVQYYFVGDAAFGVPYFRSINNGFLSANVLAKVLAQQADGDLNFGKVAHAFTSGSFSKVSTLVSGIGQHTPGDYQRFVKGLQIRESLIAQVKRLGVRFLQAKAFISQSSYEKTQTKSRSAEERVDPISDENENDWDSLAIEEVPEGRETE